MILGGALAAALDRQENGAALRPRRLVFRDSRAYWNIFAADCSVIHTPQARGMPTNAQNTAAFQSRPPLPMPYEPAGTTPALAACNLATSSWLMYHLGLTGLTRKLQIRPMISMPHRMYMVKS